MIEINIIGSPLKNVRILWGNVNYMYYSFILEGEKEEIVRLEYMSKEEILKIKEAIEEWEKRDYGWKREKEEGKKE